MRVVETVVLRPLICLLHGLLASEDLGLDLSRRRSVFRTPARFQCVPFVLSSELTGRVDPVAMKIITRNFGRGNRL